MISKILIANRGEIALRIMRTCREMDILTVAVFSEADRSSLHVSYADEAYFIGDSPSDKSYLNINNIIEAAKNSGAGAIHPGYGFLSENADFARRCNTEGIIFIGPSSHSISVMGDKITARQTMIMAGVPVVPGTKESFNSSDNIDEILEKIGLPLLIKATAGGGGKGMRLVKSREEFAGALKIARSEAKAAFGDDSVYIEKYIDSPHHIEFQIIADNFGNVVHLFERECSVQRRHQKIIEETPSVIMTDELREEMGERAVRAAKAVNYSGAGTIEFLVDNDLNYYFLEMNTRLQVEHPITERVTGIDLVKEQINIANGKELSFKQYEIRQFGHAIECRIYAEDPENNFMPSPGIVTHIREPHGLGVRCDGYVYKGYNIPVYYDPLISKLIVWGKSRDEAIKRMKRALYEYKISGVSHNIALLEKIMDVPDFADGKYDTGFIEKNQDLLSIEIFDFDTVEDLSAITVFLNYINELKLIQDYSAGDKTTSKWKISGRNNF